MTVAELGDRITSREVTEWAAYERVYGPLGMNRGDIQAALIAHVIANVNRKKGTRAIKIEDLLPQWDKAEPEELTPEEERQRVFAAFGVAPEPKRLLDAKGNPIAKPSGN